MALQSCYECNKDISTKAIICPQCGAPQNPVSGLIDKAGGFLKNAFQKGKNHLEMEMNRREIKRKINEDLEKIVEGNFDLRWLVNYNNLLLLPNDKKIQDVMDEMEIERGTEYGWETEIWLKLLEIRHRRKEEEEESKTKKEEYKTILSRFRPKE
jgi:hypothetical protein